VEKKQINRVRFRERKLQEESDFNVNESIGLKDPFGSRVLEGRGGERREDF